MKYKKFLANEKIKVAISNLTLLITLFSLLYYASPSSIMLVSLIKVLSRVGIKE